MAHGKFWLVWLCALRTLHRVCPQPSQLSIELPLYCKKLKKAMNYIWYTMYQYVKKLKDKQLK